MINSTAKSFLLHKDSLLILDKLTDAQAGKLFKAIKTFQLTGQIMQLDFALEIAFSPFLNQFSRDKESYSNSVLQGKLGNLKKYHKEIYQRVIAKELTIEEGEDLAYPDKKLLCRPPITPDQVGSHSVSDSDSVSDNKKDNKKEIEAKPKGFIPPTLEEVKNYCKERNNNVDADKFLNFYESKGWLVGKSKMKDWKASVRTWEKPKEPNKFSQYSRPTKTDHNKEILRQFINETGGNNE